MHQSCLQRCKTKCLNRPKRGLDFQELSGHYSRDWSGNVNVIEVTSNHSPVNLDSE